MLKIDLTFWSIIAFEYDTPQQTFWVIISARPKKHYQSNNAADFPEAILYVYSQSYAELKNENSLFFNNLTSIPGGLDTVLARRHEIMVLLYDGLQFQKWLQTEQMRT